MSRMFDEKELLERIDNDWDFLTETVQMLASDAPRLLEEMRRATDASDPEALGRSAHTLKGMISNFCFPAVQASVLAVETMGKTGDLSSAPAAVQGLDGQVAELIAGLNKFLATRA